jgi:hypothetical protein
MAFWGFKKTPCCFCTFLFLSKDDFEICSTAVETTGFIKSRARAGKGRSSCAPQQKRKSRNKDWLNTLKTQGRPPWHRPHSFRVKAIAHFLGELFLSPLISFEETKGQVTLLGRLSVFEKYVAR